MGCPWEHSRGVRTASPHTHLGLGQKVPVRIKQDEAAEERKFQRDTRNVHKTHGSGATGVQRRCYT